MTELKPLFDYELDFHGWIAQVVADTDAKAKYAAYKVFQRTDLFRDLRFRDYISSARISGKVRKIA